MPTKFWVPARGFYQRSCCGPKTTSHIFTWNCHKFRGTVQGAHPPPAGSPHMCPRTCLFWVYFLLGRGLGGRYNEGPITCPAPAQQGKKGVHYRRQEGASRVGSSRGPESNYGAGIGRKPHQGAHGRNWVNSIKRFGDRRCFSVRMGLGIALD